ncbi:MAG: DUF1080 domain-containing protein [Rikenellaceae bacterium]
MKKILLLAIISIFSFSAMAQSPAGRESKTIVADVLAQMPTQNVEAYNQMMDDLVTSGESGILQLASMLAAPGKGDNTAVEYALGGLSYYVSTPGKEASRAMVTTSLIKALDAATDREIKAFLIRMTQITSKDDAIPTLKKYALSDNLYEEAIRALAYINSKNSIAAIIEVAPKVADKSVVAQVAGERKITALTPTMIEWFKVTDTKLHKAVTRALSELTSEEGLTLLAKEAAACNYGYNDFETTNAFTKTLAAVPYSVSKSYVGTLSKPNLSASVRKQAMAITLLNNPTKSTKIVLAAIYDGDRKYRNDVLSMTDLFDVKSVSAALEGKFNKFNDQTKCDVINWFKTNNIASALPADFITSENGELRKAAMRYEIAMDTPESINSVIKAFKSDNKEVLADAAQALLWSKFSTISNENLEILNGATKNGKIAILNFLASRNVPSLMPLIVSNTVSSDKELQKAAFKALTVTSKVEDIPMLYDYLDKATDCNVASVQTALGEKLKMLKKDDALKSIEQHLTKGIKERKYALYAFVPTKESVSKLQKAIETETGDAKQAAAQALIAWPNTDALDVVYGIICDKSQSSLQPKAIKNSVSLINSSKLPDAQKFLMLRRIMDVTKDATAKNDILDAMGNLNSLNALLYVAPYMNVGGETAQFAAFAAMKIALKDATYQNYGKNVEEILNKFAEIRTGSEAGYEKQSVKDYMDKAPKNATGFVSIFNGKDLSGWKGLVKNPIARSKMSDKQLSEAQVIADQEMQTGWKAEDGLLIFTGKGNNLCTEKKYGDFEMYVDWKIEKDGDAGIYLRGTPQVQIWDTCRRDVGAEVGSGALYNNTTNISTPLVLADNKIGEWNTFYIKMVGERVTVYLNGQKVVDNVIMENYWDRNLPIFLEEQLELQAHGTLVAYRDIYVKELPKVEPLTLCAEEQKEGFEYLFDGVSMSKWTGNTKDYVAQNGTITLNPKNGGGGNLYTKKEYDNFVLRFEFQLTPAANNGLGIRTPLTGDAAYVGMELQILDSEHPVYKDLKPYQYHGSVYGVIPAKRGFLKPTGEWNCEEVIANGDNITVKINGEVIVDGNIRKASQGGTKTADGKQHPGLLNKTGHIGFLGHGAVVSFKNIRVKELTAPKKK